MAVLSDTDPASYEAICVECSRVMDYIMNTKISSITKHHINNIFSTGIYVLCIAGMITVLQYKNSMDDVSLVGIIFNSMGGMFLTSSLLYPHIKSFIDSLSRFTLLLFCNTNIAKYFNYYHTSTSIEKYLLLDNLFQQNKHLFDAMNYTRINRRLIDLYQLIRLGHLPDKELDSRIEFIEKIFLLPHDNYVIDDTQSVRIYNELIDCLQDYPQHIRNNVIEFSAEIISSSRTTSSDCMKSLMYFVGPAGTGKTHLAKKFINIMGLMHTNIDLSSDKAKFELFGTSSFSCPQTGSIVNTLLTLNHNDKRHKNFILFIDEADKPINKLSQSNIFNNSDLTSSDILQLLDPNNKTIYDHGLGIDIDVSRMIIIMTGNESITNDALRSRIRTIQFDAYTYEQKCQMTPNLLKSVKSGYSNIEWNSEDDAIIQQIIRIDNNEGVRIIKQVIKAYIIYKQTKSIAGFIINPFDITSQIIQHGCKINNL